MTMPATEHGHDPEPVAQKPRRNAVRSPARKAAATRSACRLLPAPGPPAAASAARSTESRRAQPTTAPLPHLGSPKERATPPSPTRPVRPFPPRRQQPRPNEPRMPDRSVRARTRLSEHGAGPRVPENLPLAQPRKTTTPGPVGGQRVPSTAPAASRTRTTIRAQRGHGPFDRGGRSVPAPRPSPDTGPANLGDPQAADVHGLRRARNSPPSANP